jgi:hypothetical protein
MLLAMNESRETWSMQCVREWTSGMIRSCAMQHMVIDQLAVIEGNER